MSIERGVLDRFFNGYLLKKRQIWKPFKYVTTGPYRYSKWIESIIFPRNKFEQLTSNFVESMLPTLQYFVWNDITSVARQQGWTIQEKSFNSFFRNRNIYFHAMGQAIHPWGYLDRQRADGFFRRVETMIPGIELPEWAQQTNRAPNLDFESVAKTFENYRNVYSEATPSPHFNTPNYFALQHFGNQRFTLGYWAQRLFYNEKPAGNFFSNLGQIHKEDHEINNSWYAGSRYIQKEFVDRLDHEGKARYKAQLERWSKNINEHFPEFRNYNPEPANHKFDEPNYERNMEDIRDAIWGQKCHTLLNNGTFSDVEIQQIFNVFLSGDLSGFFEVNEHDGLHHATPLYLKFQKEFNLPDVFKIQKMSAKTPEQTFLDRTDNLWNINYATVDTYRRTLSKLLANADQFTERNQEVRNLVSEEVYNVAFRDGVKAEFGVSGDLAAGESVVLAALRKNNNAFDNLYQIQARSRATYPLANRQLRNQFFFRFRELLKARPFDPTL